MKITKERLQILLDNPFDERILNHERSAILNLALEANELKAENARLRWALKLYADPWAFRDIIDDKTSIPDFYGETDFGMFAREALNDLRKGAE